MSGDKNGGKSHSMKTDNSCFERAGQFKYSGNNLNIQKILYR